MCYLHLNRNTILIIATVSIRIIQQFAFCSLPLHSFIVCFACLNNLIYWHYHLVNFIKDDMLHEGECLTDSVTVSEIMKWREKMKQIII